MIGDSFISKNNNVDVSVGQSVQSRRLELGLSLEDVAKACGINSERLSSYERGEARFTADILLLLSKILKVEVGNFFADL